MTRFLELSKKYPNVISWTFEQEAVKVPKRYIAGLFWAIFDASKPYWRQMIFRKKNILIEKNISLIYNDDYKKYWINNDKRAADRDLWILEKLNSGTAVQGAVLDLRLNKSWSEQHLPT